MGTAYECFRAVKVLLRVLGAVCSGLFATQAIWLMAHPDIDDFWEGCHWLGQGLLGLFVGAGGCYLEMRGSMKKVTKHFTRFAMNRLGLSVFYFWLGCYVMGGMGVLHASTGWRHLAHATGVIAWGVALGDLLVSCSSSGGAGDEDGFLDEKKGKEMSSSKSSGADESAAAPAADLYGAQATSWGGFGSTAGASAQQADPPASSWAATAGNSSPFDDHGSSGDGPFAAEATTDNAPAGGWNTGWSTGGSKSFGCG